MQPTRGAVAALGIFAGAAKPRLDGSSLWLSLLPVHFTDRILGRLPCSKAATAPVFHEPSSEIRAKPSAVFQRLILIQISLIHDPEFRFRFDISVITTGPATSIKARWNYPRHLTSDNKGRAVQTSSA
jgi:hypothetical protein